MTHHKMSLASCEGCCAQEEDIGSERFDVGVGTALVMPFPQNLAFNVVFDVDEEEGLSEMAQRCR